MARSKNSTYRGWRSFGKETTIVRRITTRHYRAQCRQYMREERYDTLPRFRGTGGWISW